MQDETWQVWNAYQELPYRFWHGGGGGGGGGGDGGGGGSGGDSVMVNVMLSRSWFLTVIYIS